MSITCANVMLKLLEDEYRRRLYEYNTLISRWKIKLKPIHIVTSRGKRYLYLGKYWYRVEYRHGKLRWIYLGSKKPLEHLPDPPINPLEIIVINQKGTEACIYIPEDVSSEIIAYLLSLIAEGFRLSSRLGSTLSGLQQ